MHGLGHLRVSLPPSSQGTTLLELVLVILILSILSAFSFVKFRAVSDHSVAQQAQLVAETIRHAQRLAMSWGVGLRFENTSTGYRVKCLNGVGRLPCVERNDIVVDPSRHQPYVVYFQHDVSMYGDDIGFDHLGRPVLIGAGVKRQGLATQVSHLVVKSANYRWQVSVDVLTGMITRQKLSHSNSSAGL